jgi:hypothetical protein
MCVTGANRTPDCRLIENAASFHCLPASFEIYVCQVFELLNTEYPSTLPKAKNSIAIAVVKVIQDSKLHAHTPEQRTGCFWCKNFCKSSGWKLKL